MDRVGGRVPLFGFGGTKWNDGKIERDGQRLGLRQLPIDDFPHNNDGPKIGIWDGGNYEGEVR